MMTHPDCCQRGSGYTGHGGVVRGRPELIRALRNPDHTTPAFNQAQLAVVWAPRLHGEPGVPTSITGTARFMPATSKSSLTGSPL
jgi:hypothetical protein